MNTQILSVNFSFLQRIDLFSEVLEIIAYLVQTKDIYNRVNNNHVS